jgi:hypothetical protein
MEPIELKLKDKRSTTISLERSETSACKINEKNREELSYPAAVQIPWPKTNSTGTLLPRPTYDAMELERILTGYAFCPAVCAGAPGDLPGLAAGKGFYRKPL